MVCWADNVCAHGNVRAYVNVCARVLKRNKGRRNFHKASKRAKNEIYLCLGKKKKTKKFTTIDYAYVLYGILGTDPVSTLQRPNNWENIVAMNAMVLS